MSQPEKPPSRREARIARQLERQLKTAEKSARLKERPENVEAVRVASLPGDREVRIGADPGSIYRMRMCWTEDKADRSEDWSWGPRDWGQVAWDDVIHPKLLQFSNVTWGEIEQATTDNGRRMHHPMATDAICNEAMERLFEIDLIEDDIYRFRLGNRRRLWGFRRVNVFEILWYDPLHKVYPTEPD